LSQFTKNYIFTPKLVTKLLGSGKKPILDPGSKSQKGTGSRIRNTEKYKKTAGSKGQKGTGSATLKNIFKKFQEKNTSVPEDGLVDVLGPVGGTHDKDGALVVRGEAVPQLHELCLDHGRRLVVVLVPNPQQAV
jgi:hypothetical protein